MQVIWYLKFCNMTKSEEGGQPPAPNSGGTCPPSPVIYAHGSNTYLALYVVVLFSLKVDFKSRLEGLASGKVVFTWGPSRILVGSFGFFQVFLNIISQLAYAATVFV